VQTIGFVHPDGALGTNLCIGSVVSDRHEEFAFDRVTIAIAGDIGKVQIPCLGLAADMINRTQKFEGVSSGSVIRKGHLKHLVALKTAHALVGRQNRIVCGQDIFKRDTI